jgi:4a-hydroxytetrahydrobiopterin dehydratase
MSTHALTGQQIAALGLEGWTFLLHYGQGGLETRVRTADFATGARIVQAICAAAAELDHHAELDLRPSRVDVRLSSRSGGGVTSPDVELARRISSIAAVEGCALSTEGVARIELGLDTPSYDKIASFWTAVLATEHVVGTSEWGDVGDPQQALPMIYFRRSSSPGRWHPDLWVDPSEVPARLDAAITAGGTLVDDSHAPSFWVVADPDGNEVRLCTWQPGESVLCDSQYRP